MIRSARGDILESDAEALVNTVNCVGVMGRGVALHFKNAFPDNYRAYAAACEDEEVQPGRMFVHETGRLTPRWIINFPTKRHWRGKSKMEDVEAGIIALREEIVDRDIRSIAIPPLGSGLGGLDWSEVRPMIETGLSDLPRADISIYEPGAEPREVRPAKAPRMTAGRAALVGLIRRYLTGMMESSISLLEVHKLMYFMQEAGEPLKLRYTKAPKGPYAENLRHVMKAINGHLITGYTADGDSPTETIGLVDGAGAKAEMFLADHPTTRANFERVAAITDGFETPFGLELLATTHWVMANDGASTREDLLDQFYAWDPAKERFKPEQVVIAASRLHDEGWVIPEVHSE